MVALVDSFARYLHRATIHPEAVTTTAPTVLLLTAVDQEAAVAAVQVDRQDLPAMEKDNQS